MATGSTPFSAETVDRTTGQILPMSEEERLARFEALRRLFEEWEAAPPDESDTEEIWREVMRSIDEGRPHRPLFEGMY